MQLAMLKVTMNTVRTCLLRNYLGNMILINELRLIRVRILYPLPNAKANPPFPSSKAYDPHKPLLAPIPLQHPKFSQRANYLPHPRHPSNTRSTTDDFAGQLINQTKPTSP